MSVLPSFDPGGATGVLAPPRLRTRKRARRPRGGDPPPRPPHEGDGGGDGGRGDGPGDGPPAPAPGAGGRPEDTGAFALALTLTGIATLFAVIVAIWVLLRWEKGERLTHASTPLSLWSSTLWLLLSSLTYELALHRDRPRRMVGLTLLLGLAFLANQAWLWFQLVSAGDVPAKSGYAAILFAVSGLHALHLLGGLAFTAWLFAFGHREGDARTRRRRLRLGSVYWHFMGVLWAGLFTLLILLG